METSGREESMPAAADAVKNHDMRPRPRPIRGWNWHTGLVAIPLALVVAYAFAPILDNDFVGWDDLENFVDNPHFRGFGADQLKWAWTTFWVGTYQPLAWLLYEAEYVVWQLDPRGYHLTSLLFLIADAVVLYFLTLALLARSQGGLPPKSPWPRALSAGLATALFMTHPLRVEVVAWASGQPYLPCALFSMLAVLAYLRANGPGPHARLAWLAGSFFLFIAALLFHAIPVSLPIVLLILDVYPLGRFENESGRWPAPGARRALVEKIPFLAVSLLFMVLAAAAKPHARFRLEPGDTAAGIAQACYATWFYIVKTMVPLNLIAFYPPTTEVNWRHPAFILSVLGTLGLSAGLFLARRRWPGLLAIWISYLVVLGPNSGFVRINDQVVADRYSFMSMLGFVTLAAGAFCWLIRMWSPARTGRVITAVIGLGALVVLTPMARSQSRTWLNSEVLWRHALARKGDESHMAHYNLGLVLQTRGNYPAAAAHYAAALRLKPEYGDAHYNMGTIFYLARNYEAARAHFEDATRLRPEFVEARYNLGYALFHLGKCDSAIAQFAEAIRLRSGFADGYNASAIVMMVCPDEGRRDPKRAVEMAHRACELTDWKNPEMLTTLAAACAGVDDLRSATSWQQRAAELEPLQGRKDVYMALLALYQAGRHPTREFSARGLEPARP